MFNTYLHSINEEKNVHQMHIEQLSLRGIDELRRAITAFQNLRDELSSNGVSSGDISVKWDGCVHENTIVLTNNGDKTIKDIINNSDNYKVLTKNLDSDLEEFSNILGSSARNTTKKWIEIEYINGEKTIVTEDHEFYTINRGYVRAKDLNDDDDILEKN